jgi:hypothetical protein
VYEESDCAPRLALAADNHIAGFSDSYMGVCQMQDRPGRVHRRLDIKVGDSQLAVAAVTPPCTLRLAVGVVTACSWISSALRSSAT